MDITVSIPDNFVPPAAPNREIARQLLEAYAIENYRQERMSLGRVAEFLGLTIDETHAFFKEHKVPMNYDLDDLERDRQNVELFLKR